MRQLEKPRLLYILLIRNKGSLFMIVTYLIFKKLHTTTTLLIFFLGLADFGLGLSNLLSWVIRRYAFSDNLCVAQAAGMLLETLPDSFLIKITGTQYFAICSFLWRACIAFHAHAALCRNKTKEELQRYIKFYVLVCTLLPLLLLIICLKYEVFGPSEEHHLWCWITKGNATNYTDI